jgi:hypothetical protein
MLTSGIEGAHGNFSCFPKDIIPGHSALSQVIWKRDVLARGRDKEIPINPIFDTRLAGSHDLHRDPPLLAYRMNSRSHPNYLILLSWILQRFRYDLKTSDGL